MSLKELGEFGFIRRIREDCLNAPARVIKGIGDDAAVFRTGPESLMLMTTDMLVEGVHFVRGAGTGFQLGGKALAVNLSDIAAMGGTPSEAVVSLAVPEDEDLGYLDELYRGMKEMARRFVVNILGGDTTRSKSDLTISITLAGTVSPGEILTRDGAKPGDVIVTSGPLGDSRAGLYLIQNNIREDAPEFKVLLDAHLQPAPQVLEGRFLAAAGEVHSAIDVSDGLGSDVAHIALESGVGIRISAEKIPVSKELDLFCRRYGFDPSGFALVGGEDYVLLATVAPEKTGDLIRSFTERFGRPLFPIGEVTGGDRMVVVLADGKEVPLETEGWDHFRKGIP